MEESCDAERALHAAMMEAPRRAVTEADLSAIVDEDARDNYKVVLRFRERLLAAGTIEGAYLELFRSGGVDIPPLFIEQMVHVILRNVLDGCEQPLQLRAAELFFRDQKLTLQEGAILVADLETVEMHAAGNAYGSIGRLIVEAQTSLKSVELDVLDRENADLYWQRESRFDTVISLNNGRAALEALCRVIEAWVAHFHGVKVRVKPLAITMIQTRPHKRASGGVIPMTLRLASAPHVRINPIVVSSMACLVCAIRGSKIQFDETRT